MKYNLSAEETLAYNYKDDSKVISINNLQGESWKDFERQMLARQKLFGGRAKSLMGHIFISPTIADGRRLTLLDWKEIARRFLEKANLTSYQSVVFLHEDTDHFHIHIVLNRIDKNGLIYREKNELAMSQRIGDEIAKERGLIRASVVRNERMKNKSIIPDRILGSVAKMRVDLLNVANSSTDNGENFVQEKYFEGLRANGYKVKVFFKRAMDGALTKEIVGYSIGKDRRFIKASSISPDLTIRKLKQNKFHAAGDVQTITAFKIQVEDILRKSILTIHTQKVFDPLIYFENIRSLGYTVKEYFNSDTGTLRGYGIEKDGILINASEIGIEFTLKNLKKLVPTFHSQNLPPQITYEETPVAPQSTADEQYVSKELIRAIDLVTIGSEIKDLISGHRYNSYDEFIKALEHKGYRVHLRYLQGQLTGYTIHFGAEHYHDHEIGNEKEFSLNHLVEKNIFKTQQKANHSFQNPIAGTFNPTEKQIDAQEKKTDEINIPVKVSPAPIPIERIVIIALEKEKIKKRIALELLEHLRATVKENKVFDPDRYFDLLEKNGFGWTKHFAQESEVLRGYSVTKYGITFSASEIGREFTLKALQSNGIESNKTQKPRMNKLSCSVQ